MLKGKSGSKVSAKVKAAQMLWDCIDAMPVTAEGATDKELVKLQEMVGKYKERLAKTLKAKDE